MLPSLSPKQLTLTVCGLLTGATLFAVGAHLSFVNVAPQRARAQARAQAQKEYIKARLKRFLDD